MLLFFFKVSMLGQMILAFAWLLPNLSAIPTFGDTNEYIALSTNLRLDEYRPILYPLLLKIVIDKSSFFHFEYQFVLFSIQLAVNFFATFFAVRQLIPINDFLGLENRPFTFHIFITFYLMSIPMIMFMNLSIMTDSLALSGLIFFLINMHVLANRSTSNWKNWLFIYLSFRKKVMDTVGTL